MRQSTDRVAHLNIADHRDEFVAMMENVLPGLERRAEQLSLYLLLAAFWGLVLYFAVLAL